MADEASQSAEGARWLESAQTRRLRPLRNYRVNLNAPSRSRASLDEVTDHVEPAETRSN